MNFLGNEDKRRKLDTSFDSEPSVNHIRNYFLIAKYIKNKSVLDVGCWTGQFEQLIFKSTKQIVGIDPGKNAIEYAKKKIPQVRFLTGTLESVNLQRKSFDVILLLDVLEHLPKGSEVRTFKKIHSLLRSNGRFIISTPNSHILSVLLDPAFYLIGHRHYSPKSLTKMLKESGFSVEKIFTYGNIATLIDGIFDVVEKHLFHKKIFLRKFIQSKSADNKSGFASVLVIAKKEL